MSWMADKLKHTLKLPEDKIDWRIYDGPWYAVCGTQVYDKPYSDNDHCLECDPNWERNPQPRKSGQGRLPRHSCSECGATHIIGRNI